MCRALARDTYISLAATPLLLQLFCLLLSDPPILKRCARVYMAVTCAILLTACALINHACTPRPIFAEIPARRKSSSSPAAKSSIKRIGQSHKRQSLQYIIPCRARFADHVLPADGN